MAGLHLHPKFKERIEVQYQAFRTMLVQACLINDHEKIREVCEVLCKNGIMLKELNFSPGHFQFVGDKIIESGFKPKCQT